MYFIIYLDNDIRYEGIKSLSNNLIFISKLVDLDISSILINILGNLIEDEGMIYFSQYLKYIPHLKTLNISCIKKLY